MLSIALTRQLTHQVPADTIASVESRIVHKRIKNSLNIQQVLPPILLTGTLIHFRPERSGCQERRDIRVAEQNEKVARSKSQETIEIHQRRQLDWFEHTVLTELLKPDIGGQKPRHEEERVLHAAIAQFEVQRELNCVA